MSCFAPRQYTATTRHVLQRNHSVQRSRPPRRPPTRGAFEVLTSLDIMLLVFDFQRGVYNAYHPLRQLGYFTLTVPPPSMGVMDAMDDLLSPWLANFTRPRMLAFLRSTDRHRHLTFAAYAAYVGHLPAVRMLLEDTIHEWAEARLIDWAAFHGHLHVIRFVRKTLGEAASCSPWAVDTAATNNHLHVLKWLDVHCEVQCTAEAVYGASRHGHLEVLQWLAMGRRARSRWFEHAVVVAASAGHIDVLKWLHSQLFRNGRTYSRKDQLHEALAGAMANGHTDIVLWMRRRVLPTGEIDDLDADGIDANRAAKECEAVQVRPSRWRRMSDGMATQLKLLPQRPNSCATLSPDHGSPCSIQ